ncbi:MAG TPA: gliding motility-associated C-terminal domain-containing protein, partial [Phaeodactylibacter sp.]|nr:gliding motility-associated C-terminal domain-containing protein [Phaeodactylibacter sp.]
DQFTYIVCNAHCLDKCSESTVTIEIGRYTECLIPEVMTPNNDGLNDAFIVPCLDNYDGNILGVYNRWGDEVYHDEDYKNDWTGIFKGENLPVGTYYYVLKINDGNDTVKKGYIFIQR